MLDNPYLKAGLGALFIGVGIAIMASAVKDVKTPCVDCGDAEEVAAEVAQASAEMNGDAPDEETAELVDFVDSALAMPPPEPDAA